MIFFLNSTNRVYKDEELNKVASLLFSDGIFNTKSASLEAWRLAGDFKVEASGADMNITAKAGSATKGIQSDGKDIQAIIQEAVALSASVASNLSLAVRSDAVVLRIDQSVIDGDTLNAGGTNAVSLTVISGNSATPLTDNEIAVALSNDPFIRLANINVPLSTSVITNEMIVDTREVSKFTRSAKAAFDILRLYTRNSDPLSSELEKGDIWYNEEDNVLKFFNGDYVQALQLESFDWGYYPPDGVDTNVANFESLYENSGEDGGLSSLYILYATNSATTYMAEQVFTMPASALPNPFIQVKLGAPSAPSGPASLRFSLYTVDASNNPLALVETVANIDYSQVPQNDYVSLYLNGSLYTAGVKYALVVLSTRLGNLNTPSDGSAWYHHYVKTATKAADAFFVGTKSGYVGSATTTPTSLTWGGLGTNTQFIMRLASRDELAIGETDATGKTHKIVQRFTAKSRDMIGFRVIKGANIGSPTGSLTAHLYACDDNDLPTGNVLTSGTIEGANWTGPTGTNMDFPLIYDELIVGTRYCVVIDTEFYSTTDNYTIYFGNYVGGKAYRYNTVDGYITLSGDIFYSIITTSIRKIIVTRGDGKVPNNIIDWDYFQQFVVGRRSGVFTKNTADASVGQVIPHGLGRTPKKVTFKAVHATGSEVGYCFGTLDDAGQNCVFAFSELAAGDNAEGNSNTFVMRLYAGTTAGEYQTATCTVDDTNINLTWTLTNTPVGTYHIIWEVE